MRSKGTKALKDFLEKNVCKGDQDATSKKRGGKEGKWAWKKVEPAEGEPKQKQFNGKTYHWCPNHQQWTIHTPEECRGVAKKDGKKDGKKNVAFPAETETEQCEECPDEATELSSVLESFCASISMD